MSQVTLTPNGAGLYTQIYAQSPASGSHYDKVADSSDTTYIYQPIGDYGAWRKDLYTMTDTAVTGTINWVRVYFRGVGDGTVDKAKTYLYTESTEYAGSEVALPATVGTSYTAYTNNPNTGIAWTWAEVNALQAGVVLYNYSKTSAIIYEVYVVVDYSVGAGPVAPTVTISAATSILQTTATISGNVTDTGGENPTVTVYWGTSDGLTTPGNWDESSAPDSPSQPQTVASFTKALTGLTENTLYYYSAKATNSAGTDWPAASGTFTTARIDLMFAEYSREATELSTAPFKFYWSVTLGKLFCVTATHIHSYNGIGWATEETLSGITDIIEYNGVLYVGLGASTLYKYSTDGSTWTSTDLTDGYANHFLVAPNPEGTQDVLWKSKNPNEVSRTTNGKLAGSGGVQWSTPAYIGDTTTNITNMFIANDLLMIGKTDGLFNYDSSGGVHTLMPDLRTNKSDANFQYVTNWQSEAYFSLYRGVSRLTSYNSIDLSVGPLANTGNIDKVGDIVGISSDKDNLFVAILEGSVIHIYRGRFTTNVNGTTWKWCPWVYVGANPSATIQVVQHSATDRRLWFGYGTHTGYVSITDNPTTDTQARFSSTGWLRGSYIYGTNPYWDKLFQSVVTDTHNCSANRTVQIKYRKDTDTTATAFTSTITSDGVNSTKASAELSAKRIQFEIHLATNDNTQTPEIRILDVKGVEVPQTTRIHEVVYSLGTEPSHKAKTIRDFLNSARTSTTLIKLADLRWDGKTSGTATGDYVWVVMMPGYPREVSAPDTKGRQKELLLQCRWQEVDFTIS